MPTEDEYTRRQILQHSKPASPSLGSRPQCVTPVCVPPLSAERYVNDARGDRCVPERFGAERNHSDFVSDRNQSDRFATDRVLSDRFGTERNQADRFIGERNQSDRFGSERSQSDRLPSGERYQGVSERYPLGERPQTSVSSDRLVANQAAHVYPGDNRYITYHRYPERYTPVGSLERQHPNHDRYSRAITPSSMEIYNTLATDKDRDVPDRYFDRYNTISHEKDRFKAGQYIPSDQYKVHINDKERKRCSTSNDRYISVQTDIINDRQSTQSNNVCPADRFSSNERHKGDKRERSGSGDRKSRYQYQHEKYVPDNFQNDRFPPIPCPEGFASQDGTQFNESSYLEPPSPAPASDRFIPPPPLSPETPTSPICYSTNELNAGPKISDRFVSPPQHVNSTQVVDNFSPNKTDRRYQYSSSERYNPEDRFKDIQYGTDRYQVNSGNYNCSSDKYAGNERYEVTRYGPQNPHMPVERYVPQQQPENYYGLQYDRYSIKMNSNDPYMRRDLSNFQFRLPIHLNQPQYQKVRYISTPSRTKCCQYSEGYHLSKSSPGSSSSSSVASQNKEHIAKEVPVTTASCVSNAVNASLQDIQCQNLKTTYQQEKATQCVRLCNNSKECVAFVSPNMRVGRGRCRHSICVSPSMEYMGSNGSRYICATPPPRNSVCSPEGVICNEGCCAKRGQTSLTVAIWRSSPAQTQTSQSPPQTQAQISQEQSTTSPSNTTNDETEHNTESTSASTESTNSQIQTIPSPPVARNPQLPVHSRAVSLPVTSPTDAERTQRVQRSRGVNYSQSERIPNRPMLQRQMSKKEILKNYLKKETATFFGVDEENEVEQQNIWLDRRKRMASRAYGPLKEEYRTSTLRSHRRTVSEIPTRPSATSGQLNTERPDVLPGPSDVPDGQDNVRGVTLRRKESVARMTWDGLSYVVTTLARHRPRPRSQQNQWSRSFPPDTQSQEAVGEESTSFFEPTETAVPRLSSTSEDVPDIGGSGDIANRTSTHESYTAPGVGGWKRKVPRGVPRQTTVGKSRITNCLDNLLDNSDRRQYGMGWVGRMFGRTFKKSVAYDENIQEQLDDLEDHRPMFTYWVTIVQILVLFISLGCYGFGPFGIDLKSRSGQVLVTSLSLQQVDYLEPANFWFGPRAADLIHLGAKFAPCMRIDAEISQEIEKIRTIEKETACCIRNDDSGCVQSSKADCSETISTWKKWSDKNNGPGGRISGSVCGLDPKFCDAPASVHPYEWPDDITKWPICRKTNASKQNRTRIDSSNRDKHLEHMVCEIIGHPCCIGIHGQCKITTREYCDFVRGTFHEEASLCSQVSCLNDVCGMLPFYFPETPDQFYRLWTSLFLHAGILQLGLTIIIHYFLMKDLEKLTGSLRICLIYMGSGVAGNLASAIFVPYRADVGPAGSQFGLLACLIVEVLNAWPMLKHPKRALSKLLCITFVLFLVGLLPWVDNYAHLFGFVFGFLLSYALLPFISFGSYDRQKKIILIWICLLSAGILFIFLLLLFYVTPVYNCKICSYFNCLPLTRDFCASQNINFKREEPIV